MLKVVEEGFRVCKGIGSAAYNEQTRELIWFSQDTQTKYVLATSYTKNKSGYKVTALRYAFLTSDGHVLPEPEFCGQINGPESVLDKCLETLRNGFMPFVPQ